MSDAINTTQLNDRNTPSLQPMGVGEILDTTFSFYRNHFLLFLGIAAVHFFGSLVKYSLEGFFSSSGLPRIIPNFVNIPFALVSTGAVIIATATIYLDGNITSRDALQQTLRRFWHLLVCHLIWILVATIPLISIIFLVPVILLGTSLASILVIPLCLAPFSIYFAVRWGFVAETLLLEKTNVQNAFKRSSELVRGRWWRVCGILVLILLLSAAIHYIFEISLGIIFVLAKSAGGTDLKTIIQWAVMETELGSGSLFFYAIMTTTDLILKTFIFPIWVIGITLLYFDQRIRKEGFDLEIQVDSSAVHGPESTAPQDRLKDNNLNN